MDYTASGAVDAAHHALWLGDASTGAAQTGKELAEEVRWVVQVEPIA